MKQKWSVWLSYILSKNGISFLIPYFCVYAHARAHMCVYVYMCAYNMQISVDWYLFTMGFSQTFFSYYHIICQRLILFCCSLGRRSPRQLTLILYPWSSCHSTLWAAVSGTCHYAWALSLTFNACMRTYGDLPVCLSHLDGNFYWH